MSAVETQVAAAIQQPVSLRWTDQSLIAVPPQWKIRLIPAGEHVFGARLWTVE